MYFFYTDVGDRRKHTENCTARPRLVRMTGPEKNRTNQKRTIYLLKPKITLKSAKTRAK